MPKIGAKNLRTRVDAPTDANRLGEFLEIKPCNVGIAGNFSGPFLKEIVMAKICELTEKRPMKGSTIWGGKSKKSVVLGRT